MGTAEVDPRVLQANERTLLAWIRTALAVMAVGFVIARVGLWLHAADPSLRAGPWSVWLGASFILVGTLTNIVSAVRFARARRAIVEGRPIPSGGSTAISLALGLAVLQAVLFVYVITS